MATPNPFNKTALRSYFGDIDFPAHRDELISKARDKGAGEPFVQALIQIPKKDYPNLNKVHHALMTTGGRTQPGAE